MTKKQVCFWLLSCAAVMVFMIFAAAGGSSAVSTIAENAIFQNRKTIVIDAGHGDPDGGATSCTGVLESHFNLEIARRTNDMMHLLGIRTKMIRKDNLSVYTEGESIAAKKLSDLKERVKIVNNTDEAILVSIHQNQYIDSRYSGAQIFYADTPDSKELADKMQLQFISILNEGSKRQSKRSKGVYLMEHIDKTGILVECGFLSNLQEESKLRDPEYQKKIAAVISCVCSSFVNAP